MSEDLDELFGQGDDAPTPRTRLVWVLLATGTLLALFGLACTSVPGGLVVLAAWSVVDKERDRVETGYLPESYRAEVEGLHRATVASVFGIILIFFVQGWLFMAGFYEGLLTAVLRALLGVE